MSHYHYNSSQIAYLYHCGEIGLNDILPLHQKHSANREKCTWESCDTLFICATKENTNEEIVKELIKDMIDSQVWNHYINR